MFLSWLDVMALSRTASIAGSQSTGASRWPKPPNS